VTKRQRPKVTIVVIPGQAKAAPKKNRHHQIPRFYLKGFAHELVWTYDTERGTARSSSVDATAFEKHLYSFTLEGKRHTELEDVIAEIESRAADPLMKLLKAEPLSDEDRAHFASFMGIMVVRTDAWREQMAQARVHLAQLKIYATAAHEGAFQTFLKKFQQERGPVTTDQAEIIRGAMLRPNDFIVTVNKEGTLGDAFGAYDKLVEIFFDMHWSILEAKEPAYFITSDNPVIWKVPRAYQHPILDGGLMHEKVELTMPLTSERCLLATWDKSLPSRTKLDAALVKAFNRDRAIHARRFLFGPIMDTGIQRLAAKYKGVRPGMKLQGPVEFSPVELRRR
jgi:hypothetical protein